MMNFSTPVDIKPASFDISFRDSLMLTGSCFAEEIGARLTDNKFDADINPFGIMYNPRSIETAMRRLMTGERFSETDLFFHEGRYHSFLHHSRFSSVDREETLEKINTRMADSSSRLVNCNRLIITWGTAFFYKLKNNGQTVANCHKLPADRFVRDILDVDDIVNSWENMLSSLIDINRNMKIILTISPVRHWKDGANGNNISKAILLIAADRLSKIFPNIISYFPAYEIMMDELRDYRYYADDMIHPSGLAVEYIWEKFRNTYFNSETREIYNEWQSLKKAFSHVPFNTKSEAFEKFISVTLSKTEKLLTKYPFLNLSSEISSLHSLSETI